MNQLGSKRRRLQCYREILEGSEAAQRGTAVFSMPPGGAADDELLYQNVLAPALLQYILWLLCGAERAGRRRIYFLARDGYPMYLAAKRLAGTYRMDVECRYLKVSRYSVRVPEYHLLGKACLERICTGGMDVTFEKIMKRAALNDDEARETAGLAGYGERFREVLNYREIMRLKQILSGIPQFFSYVDRHSREAYENAVGYLVQEGLTEPVSYVLADSGWTGTLQQSIKNLLRREKPDIRMEGYYFGLYEIPEGESVYDYHAFYFSPWDGVRRKAHFSNCLFEAVFSAPEGMTVGYEKSGERYLPVENTAGGKNRVKMERYARLLDEYMDRMENDWYGGLPLPDIRLAERLLTKFMGHPARFEAQAYGGLLFSDDMREDDSRPVCAGLSEKDVKNQRFLSRLLILCGVKKAPLHESAWIEGSIAKMEAPEGKKKISLWHAVFYKYVIYLRKRHIQRERRKGWEKTVEK